MVGRFRPDSGTSGRNPGHLVALGVADLRLQRFPYRSNGRAERDRQDDNRRYCTEAERPQITVRPEGPGDGRDEA
jgi:hypothetical protein